jgi:hypothetical protein
VNPLIKFDTLGHACWREKIQLPVQERHRRGPMCNKLNPDAVNVCQKHPEVRFWGSKANTTYVHVWYMQMYFSDGGMEFYAPPKRYQLSSACIKWVWKTMETWHCKNPVTYMKPWFASYLHHLLISLILIHRWRPFCCEHFTFFFLPFSFPSFLQFLFIPSFVSFFLRLNVRHMWHVWRHDKCIHSFRWTRREEITWET